MKKTINFLVVTFVICILFQSSQVTNKSQLLSTRMDTLMAYKWNYIEYGEVEEPSELIIEFTRDSMIDTDIWPLDRDTSISANPYYLTDKLPLEFDNSKVGTNKNGSYIIVRTLNNEYSAYWIKELTSSGMIFICTESPYVESHWTATPKI